MAVTPYGTQNPLAVKQWERGLSVEWLKALRIAPLIGKDSNSIIQLKDLASKGAGDRITFGLIYQLTGDGVSSGNVLEGNEEALITGSESLVINELANAVRVKAEDTIDQQRVLFNLREEAAARIVDWYATRMAQVFFIQVCGYTGTDMTLIGRYKAQLDGRHWGYNAPTAPSPSRWIIAGGKATEDELGATETFDIRYIDHMVEMAQLANPQIRPVRVDGDDCYVLYLHPSQVTALRTNTSTGQWLDIAKYADMGKGDGNRIYKGALGRYNNVILRKDEFVTPGVGANGKQLPNVRRAVLLGAQAASVAFGRNFGPSRFRKVEETFDYKRELGVGVKTLFGMKKNKYTFPGLQSAPEDFGVIVLSTFAPKATGILPPIGGAQGGSNGGSTGGSTGGTGSGSTPNQTIRK